MTRQLQEVCERIVTLPEAEQNRYATLLRHLLDGFETASTLPVVTEPDTLDDWSDYIGAFHSGNGRLSETVKTRFAEIVAEKRSENQS